MQVSSLANNFAHHLGANPSPIFLLILSIFIFSSGISLSNQSIADSRNTFKKNRIKQLSDKSDRYNYYEKINNRVIKGSKSTGLNTKNIKGYGRIQNWVEVKDSKIGNVLSSTKNRISSKKGFQANKNLIPDRNLGVIADCNRNKKIDNTVIIKNSKVENALIGGTVNSGILVNKCRRQINGSNYSNNVTVQGSRVGGAAGLLRK